MSDSWKKLKQGADLIRKQVLQDKRREVKRKQENAVSKVRASFTHAPYSVTDDQPDLAGMEDVWILDGKGQPVAQASQGISLQEMKGLAVAPELAEALTNLINEAEQAVSSLEYEGNEEAANLLKNEIEDARRVLKMKLK